jgi:TRAP-type C4-dicarboxylate transport system substrate-binding protein
MRWTRPRRRPSLKAAAEAEARGWKLSAEKHRLVQSPAAKKGMKILPPSPKLKPDLKKVGAIMLARTG